VQVDAVYHWVYIWQIIHEELLLKDIEFMEKQVDEMTKHVARIDKTKKPELDVRPNRACKQSIANCAV